METEQQDMNLIFRKQIFIVVEVNTFSSKATNAIQT